jgi:carbon monoxide dehydrogenase subunit G
MELQQQFTIPTGVDDAWALLNDVGRIAPCFPGAKVFSATEESVDGQVKVKLGPVLLTYRGVLRFIERDERGHRLVMDGQGTDAKGNGSASARVTAQLTGVAPGETLCEMVTDLNITGRPAQFGRGMMLEIGNNILGKFSANLAGMLSAQEERGSEDPLAPPAPPAAGPSATPGPVGGLQHGPRRAAAPGARKAVGVEHEDSLDLLAAAGGATAKRLAPVLAGAFVVVAVIVWVASR